MRSILIFVVFFLAYNKFNAQTSIPYQDIESKSLKLYYEKKWDELIDFSKSVIKDGTDYYALHLRMAIALFEQGKYKIAASEFEKTLRFNSFDPIALEYLYYCNLYDANLASARIVSKKLNQISPHKIKEKDFLPLTETRLEVGNRFLKKANPEVGNIKFTEFGVAHAISKKISLSESFSMLSQAKDFKYTDSFYGTVTNTGIELTQNQFYTAINYQISPSLNLTPTLHLLQLKITKTTDQPSYSSTNWTNFDFCSGLMLTKKTARFNFMPFITFSSLNDTTNLDSLYSQQGLSVAYFPLANSKLSLTSTVNFHQNPSSQNYLVYRQAVAISFYKTYLAIDFCKGNEVIHLTGSNSYLLNNSSDVTKYKISALGSYNLTSKINIYAFYQIENRTRPQKINEFGYELYPQLNYSFTTLLAGIKFNF